MSLTRRLSFRTRLWITVILLWGIWAIRAHQIMQLPIFVDESLHILRAQIVFDFDDATASILPGKLLLYYYLALFSPQDVGGAFVARQAIALLAPLGAALTFALARILFQKPAVAILSMGLYALSPFMTFFERMALSDTFMMLFGLAFTLSSFRLAHRPRYQEAIFGGLLFGLALLAKLIALPWGIMPLIAIHLYSPQKSWRFWWPYLFRMGIATGIILLPSTIYVVYQEIARVEQKQEVVTTVLFTPEAQSRPQQIADNLNTYQEAARFLLTPPLLMLFILAALILYQKQRRELTYLLSFSFSLAFFIVIISAAPSTRYLVPTIPPLLIITAYGIHTILSTPYRILQPVIIGLSVWWIGLSGQFIYDSWNDPTRLTLAERDTWEYYQNAASGYALRDAAQDLPTLNPTYGAKPDRIEVAGFVAACHTLRLYLPEKPSVEMVCPYFRWNLDMADATIAEWQARLNQDGAWYILSDDEQPLDLSQLPWQWQEIAVYPRPHHGTTTRLFLVTPLESESTP